MDGTPESDVKQQLREQGQRMYHAFLLDKIELLEALKERFGSGVVDAAVAYENDQARRRWARIAQSLGKTGIHDLIGVLVREGGYEFTMEETGDGVQMCFSRCPLHEFAKEHNVTGWAYRLICAQDPFIAEGFNPHIGFKRTKTLMQGDACCDHVYFIRD